MPKKKTQRAIVRQNIMEDPRHLMRWLKSQSAGGSPEEAAKAVAKAEGVTIQTAKQSIQQVEAYRATFDKDRFDLATRKYLMSMMQKSEEYLGDLMGATELVTVPNKKTGQTEVVEMPDKTTRLEAQRVFKDIVVGMQPKTPQVEVNVAQTNQTAQISSSETNEERMRRLRKQAEEFNTLPPVVAAVPKYLDEGGDADEDDDGEETDDEE
jgi:limonene-1,2-epoxide hydrolase